jgi:hypothetical protein
MTQQKEAPTHWSLSFSHGLFGRPFLWRARRGPASGPSPEASLKDALAVTRLLNEE